MIVRPLTRPIPSTKIKATLNRDHSYIVKISPSARATRRSRNESGGMSCARVCPMSSETGTIVNPAARRPSIICGRACTVLDRSPPPSCRSTILPVLARACSNTRFTITCAGAGGTPPGSPQSCGSIRAPTIR